MTQGEVKTAFTRCLTSSRVLISVSPPSVWLCLGILSASEDHPTAEQIFEKVKTAFPTTSLATIYKTIALLKSLNEVLELGFPDGSNRYDGNKPFPHPHVVCIRCRKIMDPELISLDELKDEIGKKTGFRIHYHRLDFFGLCRECQEDL